MRRRPRPHLLTPAARETLANIGWSVLGAAGLLLVGRLMAVFPFLIGG